MSGHALLTVPTVGQRVKCVHPDDNGTGGQGIVPGRHTGYVRSVAKLSGGGFHIEVKLDQHNFLSGPLPDKVCPEAWHWGWDDSIGDVELHPNGFPMNALMAFHYHWEYSDNCYNEKSLMTDNYVPINVDVNRV